MKKQPTPKGNLDELASLKAQLAQSQQESATFRQQRDSITQQLQDLDAKSGIAIGRLNAELQAAHTRIAELNPPTSGAFGGAKR